MYLLTIPFSRFLLETFHFFSCIPFLLVFSLHFYMSASNFLLSQGLLFCNPLQFLASSHALKHTSYWFSSWVIDILCKWLAVAWPFVTRLTGCRILILGRWVKVEFIAVDVACHCAIVSYERQNICLFAVLKLSHVEPNSKPFCIIRTGNCWLEWVCRLEFCSVGSVIDTLLSSLKILRVNATWNFFHLDMLGDIWRMHNGEWFTIPSCIVQAFMWRPRWKQQFKWSQLPYVSKRLVGAHYSA